MSEDKDSLCRPEVGHVGALHLDALVRQVLLQVSHPDRLDEVCLCVEQQGIFELTTDQVLGIRQ